MKLSDVVIGQTYLSRVSGDLVRVEVLSTREVSVWSGKGDGRNSRRVFRCRNLKTGRELTRSAAALRVDTKAERERLVKAVRELGASVFLARSVGQFDRCVALREINRAVARGLGVQLAIGTYRREFGPLPSTVGNALAELGVAS